ncbi:porin [Vibrio natriegens]|uniref:porin n=1 Tax=Vibrio natriegens TaxID=691 RepID=UPI001EFE72BC|nr:porin [Vibrio natriegens]MCG9702994.1 porin [Vibrio natriegens]
MKKTLIALALASITTGAYANSPAINGGDSTNEVYTTDGASIFLGGRAEFRGDFIGTDSGDEIDGTMADSSRVRINIGGMSNISDSLSAFGFYEAEQTTGENADLTQRYAYVGLMGHLGAVSFGKQNTANVQLSNMSDIGTYTGDQKAFIDAGNEQQTNNISYIGDFDALRVQASYIAGGAFGFYEAEQATDGSELKQRYAHVGLMGHLGAVSFGKQNTANVQLSNMSDIGTYTGDQKAFIDAGNEQQTNNISYIGDFDALRVQASYIAGDNDDTDGYGLSAIYRLPMGLGLGLGYTGADQDQSQITAGASYASGGFYAGLTYTTGDTVIIDEITTVTDAVDFEGYELAAQYVFDNNFRVIGAYQNRQIDGDDAADFFELTGGYDFNQHVYAYLAYKFNQLDDNNSIFVPSNGDEDSMRLGLKYTF